MIQLVRQPSDSKLCGHACVAMITGQPLADVVRVIGHEKGTKTRALVSALRHFGWLAPVRLRRLNNPPALAIAKQPHERGGGWHWIVIWNGMRFDPGGTEYRNYGARLTSYLPVRRESDTNTGD